MSTYAYVDTILPACALNFKMGLPDAYVVSHGGTSTHHHAVGRDHRSGYEVETPTLMRKALAGAKAVLDPKGVLNPGVLFDPEDRAVGVTGALE